MQGAAATDYGALRRYNIINKEKCFLIFEQSVNTILDSSRSKDNVPKITVFSINTLLYDVFKVLKARLNIHSEVLVHFFDYPIP